MGKLDELRSAFGSNVGESMGAGRPAGGGPMHGAWAGPAAAGMPERLRGVTKARDAAEIPIDRIAPDPDQPREEFDPEALARLAESLKQRGQLQPIRVRWDEGQGSYVILCGERRWRAATMAGLASMACIIAEGPMAPGELLAIQLVENCLREDLKPIEQARAFRSLMDLNGWSVTQLSRELAIDQSGVSRALRLLDLPGAVQELVEQGTLPPATAYEVAKLDDPATQADVAARAVADGMTRAEVAEAVRRAAPRPGGKGRGPSRGKARKAISRTLRAAGCKLTIENRHGLDDTLILAALREATDQIEKERQGKGEAA